jgi:hypothetical protein
MSPSTTSFEMELQVSVNIAMIEQADHLLLTASDCSQQITQLPVCADSSWNMYVCQFGFFCCPQGQVGVQNGLYFGLCADNDVSVPATKLASTVRIPFPSGYDLLRLSATF